MFGLWAAEGGLEAWCVHFILLGGQAGEGFTEPVDGGLREAVLAPRFITPGRYGIAAYTRPICRVVPGPFGRPFALSANPGLLDSHVASPILTPDSGP